VRVSPPAPTRRLRSRPLLKCLLSQILPRTAWHARALAAPVATLTDTAVVA
jgi:hypothetical protein